MPGGLLVAALVFGPDHMSIMLHVALGKIIPDPGVALDIIGSHIAAMLRINRIETPMRCRIAVFGIFCGIVGIRASARYEQSSACKYRKIR